MTEQKANQIFKTKYPEGEIVRRNNSSAGNKFWVTFKPEGRVYYYSCATYQELLSRFGFEIVYQHNVTSVKEYIDKLEKQLAELKSGKGNKFADLFGISLEDQIKDCVKDLEEQKKLLHHWETECIID